ncbi:MAG: hypothetical protein WBF06_08970 [Candidatus Acidiferrales bacterium]
MKKLLWILLLSLSMPAAAMAQSAFDGTWKIELNNAQLPTKPDVYLLQDGMYSCKTCVPAYEVKADGQDHAVAGDPYWDTISITVVDDHTTDITEKKDGKIVLTAKVTVSPDGDTLDGEYTDSSDTNSSPVTGKGEATRVEKGPAGSSAISGSWQTTKMQSVSDNGLLFTYKVEGDSATMTTPTGQSYTAKLDGTDAPYMGDPGTTSVSVKRMGDNTIEETDKRDGKVIDVSRMTVSADGKTMTIENTDVLHGTTSQFTAEKQ